MNALLLASLLVAPAQAPAREYAFKVVEFGNRSDLKDAGVFVIRNREQFGEYIGKLGDAFRRRIPNIDWRKNQVVAAHVGTAPNAGYSLKVKRIVRRSANAVDVEVVLLRPPAGTVSAQVISYPYAIVRSERFPGNATLKVVTES